MQWLYRLAVGHVPLEDFEIPLGQAEVRLEHCWFSPTIFRIEGSVCRLKH